MITLQFECAHLRDPRFACSFSYDVFFRDFFVHFLEFPQDYPLNGLEHILPYLFQWIGFKYGWRNCHTNFRLLENFSKYQDKLCKENDTHENILWDFIIEYPEFISHVMGLTSDCLPYVRKCKTFANLLGVAEWSQKAMKTRERDSDISVIRLRVQSDDADAFITYRDYNLSCDESEFGPPIEQLIYNILKKLRFAPKYDRYYERDPIPLVEDPSDIANYVLRSLILPKGDNSPISAKMVLEYLRQESNSEIFAERLAAEHFPWCAHQQEFKSNEEKRLAAITVVQLSGSAPSMETSNDAIAEIQREQLAKAQLAQAKAKEAKEAKAKEAKAKEPKAKAKKRK
jgi:hypothetical protein